MRWVWVAFVGPVSSFQLVKDFTVTKKELSALVEIVDPSACCRTQSEVDNDWCFVGVVYSTKIVVVQQLFYCGFVFW